MVKINHSGFILGYSHVFCCLFSITQFKSTIECVLSFANDFVIFTFLKTEVADFFWKITSLGPKKKKKSTLYKIYSFVNLVLSI